MPYTGDCLRSICQLHEVIHKKKYKLINEFGLDYAEDVLDISDPTSGIFDDEIRVKL